MTKDTCSMTSQDLLAEWSHDPSCFSKTCQGCLLQTTAKLWQESFTAWPKSGTALPTGFYQHQTLEPVIEGNDGGGLDSLPTPTKTQAGGTAEQFLKRKSKADGIQRKTPTDLSLLIQWYLPTPLSRDYKGPAHQKRRNRNNGESLPDVVELFGKDTDQQ